VINPNPLGGTTFELKEPVFVAGNFTVAQATWKRYQLGGWQSEFAEVVADITSAPMVPASSLAPSRISRGNKPCVPG